jgi:acetyl-CoA synthetase
VSHPFVAEAAVVGAKDETTGQAIVAFVILRQNQIEAAGNDADVSKILREHVAKEIGPIAKPRTIIVVAELPKTRSGKIMRRLLRDVAEDRPIGDVTTLADTSVMDVISNKIAGGAND